jgi:hypothetical protein
MTLKRVAVFLALIALCVVLISPALVSAVGFPDRIVTCGGYGQPACTVCHLADLANRVLNAGIYVAIFLSALLFAWAGWKYLTNAANPGQHEEAKKIFLNVLVGLIVILGGWLVIDTLMRVLVKNKNWNTICKSASIVVEEKRA